MGVTRCRICHGRIEYLDPTGDGLAAWWAHEHHPGDHHDARPPLTLAREVADGLHDQPHP